MIFRKRVQFIFIVLTIISEVFPQVNISDVQNKEPTVLIPDSPVLVQNYPNPFNAQTMIQFYLPQSGHVSLIIYNLKGQEVLSVINENISKGYHETRIDMSQYASGIYIYKMKTSNTILNRKFVYVK